MHTWPTRQLERISGRSTLAQAIRCALNHWAGLVLLLDDGRLEQDTNTVERAMRPVALRRKNAPFAGADAGRRHRAVVATLIHSAKLNDVDPPAWLADVLERIVAGRAMWGRCNAYPVRSAGEVNPASTASRSLGWRCGLPATTSPVSRGSASCGSVA